MPQLDEKQRRIKPEAFTLVEMLFVVSITVVFATLMLKLFIDVSKMADLADSKTMAYAEIQNTLEQMRWYPFDNLADDYNGGTFATSSVNGMGSIAMSSISATDLTATLTVCWQERTGQIIGEDTNLNGILDGGEDANSNGVLDSPVQITTIISNYD